MIDYWPILVDLGIIALVMFLHCFEVHTAVTFSRLNRKTFESLLTRVSELEEKVK